MTQRLQSPICLSDIESVLEWVDSFKLTRVTKKINRDFSDAVLLAEILSVHYPKIVEMHNYPPRNSHSLKLNNWMTLNRKVLRKLKLGLCCNTMEQLANCVPGVIERVLVMVRDKIRRDEEANKSLKEEGANGSSGGSYYDTCGDEAHVLVVPVKARNNGILETVQQKVVNYEAYNALKLELKDAVDAAEVLKQKVEHLDNLLKLKDERIDELQNQLERKQARRKEAEAQQSMLSVPYKNIATSPHVSHDYCLMPAIRTSSLKTVASKIRFDESTTELEETKIRIEDSIPNVVDSKASLQTISKPSLTDVYVDVVDPYINNQIITVTPNDKIHSEMFNGIEFIEEKIDSTHDFEEFKDSEQGSITAIDQTMQKEIKNEVYNCNTKSME